MIIFISENIFSLKGLKKKILVICLLLIAITGFIALPGISFQGLSEYLSESHKADANLMIIDGWLSASSVEMLKNELTDQKYDLILIAGLESSDLEFCKIPMNGFLIFYPKFHIFNTPVKTDHIIEIVSKSKMGGIYSCHFNFYVNDSIVADFKTGENPQRSKTIWNGSLKDIDSLTIEFTNDMVDENGDRDLYIKEIIVDDTIIIPYQYNTVLDFGSIGGPGRIKNDYNSHPQIIRNKMFEFGVDSSKAIAITIEKSDFNRTLASARAVHNFLKSSEYSIKGINVVSKGIHSRRTWLTYRKILAGPYEIGIISLPDTDNPESEKTTTAKILGEALDLIYYHIVLLQYIFR